MKITSLPDGHHFRGKDAVYFDHDWNGIRTICVALFDEGTAPNDLSTYELKAVQMRAANPGKKGFLGVL